MIKLNGYLIAISVLVVLVSSETVDNRTTPHNDRLPTQPPNPLPQEGTTTTVRFLNQGTPGAPTTQPPPATTTQPVGRGPTPVRSTQVSPARQNQTPARATSSSSRPPTPTARSPSPARQGQTPAGPSTSRPPTPTRSSSMRPTPTRPASSGTSGSSTSRRTTPQNQEVSSGSMRTTPRSTPTQGSPTSSGSRRTTPASTTGGSTSMSSPPLSPTTILTPEFTTPTPSQGISSGASSELSTAGVTTLGVTSAGVSTAGVSTETAGVSTTTSGSSSMSSSPSTSPVVSTSLSTESSSGSPSTTTPISSSTSPGSTTTESTSSSSVSTSVSTASSSSASSSGSSSASSESTSTSASTTPTSTASSTSTSISSPTTPTSTASSTSTTLPDTPSTPTTPTSTPSSTTPSTTPTSMSSTTPSTTPGNGGGQLIHTQIMFCNNYGSYFLPQDPISYQEYIKHLMMAIASTCGVGPDRIQRLEMVEDPPSGHTLIQFDVLPGPGLSTEDLVMKIQEQVSTGQFKVTDKYGNVFSVQCSLPIYPMCPWTDYGPCPRERCQHGGMCRVAVSCQYFCECRSGWFGQFCEKGAETTKPPEPVKKKDNLWLLWLLIVPLVLLGLLALLLLCCCCHRCCCWGASAGPRKVQIIEEDIYQDVPACSQHGSIRSCRSMHSARPSSIYAVNPPQMASDAGSTYYHALGRPFAVAFSDNTFSAIGYATNDMGIYNSSGRKMLPAASCCGDDEIEVIMNNPGRRGSCCGSMISETGSGYHSALGNRYAVAYNDRAFNTYSSMPRMGSIRHYN